MPELSEVARQAGQAVRFALDEVERAVEAFFTALTTPDDEQDEGDNGQDDEDGPQHA